MIDSSKANQSCLSGDVQVLPALSSWTRQAVEAVGRGAVATSGLGFAFQALPKNFPVAAVTGSSGKASVANYCGQFLGCVSAIHSSTPLPSDLPAVAGFSCVVDL